MRDGRDLLWPCGCQSWVHKSCCGDPSGLTKIELRGVLEISVLPMSQLDKFQSAPLQHSDSRKQIKNADEREACIAIC